MNVAPTVVRQSPQLPALSVGEAPIATAESTGSTVASAASVTALVAKANLKDLKLTSSASGPTL
jgi:hypothetical protein